MTEKYIPYSVDGRSYKIPESKSAEFEKTYPSATIRMSVDDRTYNIPLEQKNEFMNTYSNATYAFDEPSVSDTEEISAPVSVDDEPEMTRKERRQARRDARAEDDRTGFFESLGKGLGAGVVGATKDFTDLVNVLNTGTGTTGEAIISQGKFDEALLAEDNPLYKTSANLGDTQEKLSREADPTGGDIGFWDLIKEGKLGTAMQKAVASGAESLPMMFFSRTIPGALLYGSAMAASNYIDETQENPDIPSWKRAINAAGTAALELAIERLGGPLKAKGKLTKDAITKFLNDVAKEGTETIAKRIFKGIGGVVKEGWEEGWEEVGTSFGNDILGTALDAIDGDADYGIKAQWEQLKDEDPNADAWDFAKMKGAEYMDSYIGGALSGMEISGAVKGINKGVSLMNGETRNAVQAARDNGANKDYADMYDTDALVAESATALEGALVDKDGNPIVDRAFIDNISADEAYALAGREDFSDAQRKAFFNYAVAKAQSDGLNEKLDNRLNEQINSVRGRIDEATDNNGQVIVGTLDGKAVYVKGGFVTEKGTVAVGEGGLNGPVVVIDSVTGEKTTVSSDKIQRAASHDANELFGGMESAFRDREAEQRNTARNTVSPRAKLDTVMGLQNRKMLVDLGNGLIEVEVMKVDPKTGEVMIKGKKGDLGGQAITKLGTDVFYDSLYRDENGEFAFVDEIDTPTEPEDVPTDIPVAPETTAEEGPAAETPAEVTETPDYRGETYTILQNGVPVEAEVVSQDEASDTVVYRIISENGQQMLLRSTIGEFGRAIEAAANPAPVAPEVETEPEAETAPETPADVEPEAPAAPIEPEAIDWDALFDSDPEAYFAELQNQFGEESLDILNEEIEAAQNELDTLGKAKTKSQNERLENRKRRAALQSKIEALNGMVARLSQTVAPETAPVVLEVPGAPEAVAPEPVVHVAPTTVDNPIKEAQKREKSLATQLKRIGIPHEQKQDMAFNAGKAVADFFATREEYEAYAENATDFGEYNADFEKGVDASFANRQQNTGDTPVNSVPLENEPKGEDNGGKEEAPEGGDTNGPATGTDGGGTDNGGSKEGDSGDKGKVSPQGPSGSESGKEAKVKHQYPARKGNVTGKTLIDTFGLAAVEIPDSRKPILNSFYDFMMEMAKTLGISPKSIGNGGWLTLGNLRANATPFARHSITYGTFTGDVLEQHLLLKYSRVSSIAHEWWHSLDNALGFFESGKSKGPTTGMAPSAFDGRQETFDAVSAVMQAIRDSGYTARIQSLNYTQRFKNYVLEPTESAARAFAEYIQNKFDEQGIAITGVDDIYDETQPTAEEMKLITPAIENLFNVLQEKEGLRPGTSILYQIGEDVDSKINSSSETSEVARRLANEAIDMMFEQAGREVVFVTDEQAEQMRKLAGADAEFMIASDKPVFVSNAAVAVMGIKQEKATPAQWLAMIEKAGGLKAGEDKWMGLSDWLKASDKKTLTKQEVLDYIVDNTIRIDEQHYDLYAEEKAAEVHAEIERILQEKFDDYVRERREQMEDESFDGEEQEYAIEKLREEMGDTFPYTIELSGLSSVYVTFPYEEIDDVKEWADKLGIEFDPDLKPVNDTRAAYTTDGLTNKREIALTVPTIESWGEQDEVHFGDAGDGRAVAWVRFGETYINEEADAAYEQARKDEQDFRTEMEQKYGSLANGMRSTLTEEEYAHYMNLVNRTLQLNESRKTAKEKKVLVIDEIQSKRHQEGREKGYSSDFENSVKLQELNAELEKKTARRKDLKDYFDSREENELVRLAQIDMELDEVTNVRDYDRLVAERDEINKREENALAEFDMLANQINELEYEIRREKMHNDIKKQTAIPDAPFEKNWHELAMKRMLRYAAENGYDAVAWTKGEQQAERYGIAKVVKDIYVAPSDVERYVSIKTISGDAIEVPTEPNSDVIVSGDYKGQRLSDVVGKELADKILSVPEGTDDHISGDDLKVGGEGMKGFYDKMLPAFMNKYGKKWGIKVADITLPNVEEAGRVMHSVPVTDAMKESVMEGQVMFMKRPNGKVFGWTDGKKIYLTKDGLNPNTKIHEYTHLWAQAMMQKNPKGWQSVKDLLRGTPVWNEVLNDPNYSNIHADEDLVSSEALSRVSGRDGSAKLERMAQQMVDEAKGTVRKLEARGLVQRIKDALNEFWNWVGTELFGIEKFDSVEQVTDRVLWDLMNATDLGELSEGKNEYSIIGGEEGKALANAVNQKNLIFKAGQPLDYIEVGNRIYLYENPNYNNFTAYNNGEINVIFALEIDAYRDLKEIQELVDIIYGNSQAPDGIEPFIEEIWSRHSSSKNDMHDASQEQGGIGGNDSVYARQSKLNADNGEGITSSQPVTGRAEAQNAAVDYLAGEPRLRAIENAVNEEASKLGVKVTYKTREQMPDGHQNDKGYYDPKTGEVVVCTENATSIADAIQTILHEAVAHKGLRQLMGDKFNEFINRVYESLDAETKAKVDALAESSYNGDKAVAMEEYMATLAESTDFKKNTLWDKIKSIFEDIINAILGRNDIKIGDNELRYILRASYNNMVNPRGMETMRGWAQDQMMREEYGIGMTSDEIAKLDAEYMKAVEEGDMETAQRLVLEAAKRAMPNTKMLDENGDPMVMIHNTTSAPFTVFDKKRSISPNGAIWFANDAAIDYVGGFERGETNILAFLNITNPSYEGMDAVRYAYDEGHDGVIVEQDGAAVGVVYNPNQIKSAEPVTYDDNGNVIPLSQRFNLSNDDIRFRTCIDPSTTSRETAKAVYDKVVNDTWQEMQRQFQDAYQPVRIAIDAIQQETGNIPIEDYENYLLIQNQSSSRSRVEIDEFAERYYSPIVEQVNKIIDTIMESRGLDVKNKGMRAEVYSELRQYLIAKHGLERNEYYQTHKMRNLTAAEKRKEYALAKQAYDTEVADINADTSLTDAERELKLRDAKDANDAAILEINTREVPDIRDYSGLTSLFGLEPKKFRQAEAEAQKVVDDFEAKFGAEADILWERINKATDKTLRHSYESGIISRQQYNDIKDMFEFYIPLRGFEEKTAEDIYSYARFEGNRFSSAVQTAKGRTSVANDPLAYIMSMAESEITQGNKNRAKQALYNYLLNRTQTDANGNQIQNSLMQVESVWYVKSVDATGNTVLTMAVPDHASGETYEEFEARMEALAETDSAVKSKKGKVDIGMRFQKPANMDAHYVHLKVNGVDKAIYINGDPKAADAINGTFKKERNELSEAMGKWNRFLSSMFTNYSLEFTVRNYFRDMLYSHINIGIKESDPAYRKKFRQNWRHNNFGSIVRMLKAFRAGEYDGRSLTENEAAFVEFMKNGGQTGYVILNKVETHRADLEKAIKRMQKGLAKGGVKDSTVFKYTLGGIELLNEASELVTRFAAFKTSRDMGRSVVQSVSDAKEVTVNFNTKGAQDGKGFMGMIAHYFGWSKYFFNASVQGVQNLKAMASANKLKFGGVVGGIVATGFLMPLITGAIAQLLGGDEEEYWNIPEYDRQNNFCIPIPFTKGKYAKIPLPVGFREMYAIGDMVSAMMFDKKFAKDVQSVGTDMANKLATIILPINPLEGSANGLSIWHTLAYTAAPSSAQFLIQNLTNTDWKGAPLQKEYTYNENDPQWMKAFAGNPDWMKLLSKWCNEHINADGDYNGWDWSPEKLDNTLSNLFGGVYTLIKKTGTGITEIWNSVNETTVWDIIMPGIAGDDIMQKADKIPVTGVFFGSGIDSDDRFVTDAYYEMMDYYDSQVGYIKRRAARFGYDLDEVFNKEKGKHHPKMNEIYSNKNFDFMQEWYKGNKDLEKLKDKIKNLEKKIAGKENPTQSDLNKLARLKDQFAVERREFVDDMLELD